MKALRLLRTSTFQLAAVYMGLFATSALVMLGFVYWATIGYMSRQADSTIEADIQGLAETYRRSALPGLAQIIAERIRRDPDGTSLYLFASKDYRPLGGNLDRWPDAVPADEGWVSFEYAIDNRLIAARGRVFVLSDGVRLLVGRDISDLKATDNLLLKAYVWTLALALALAILGGFLMSASVTRRIDSINQTSREIMTGRLHQRVPLSGSGDEFDQLAGNLNAMLDQIDQLVESVRHVADSTAHDLRTPLTRLRSRLESLTMQSELDQSLRAELDSCIDEADSLLNTFSALLRIARIEAGGHEASMVDVDLGTLARDACDLYRAAAEEQDVELNCRVGEAHVNGDRDLLFQATINLLDNALKHGRGSKHVVVEAADDPAGAALIVADRGPGIPAAELGKVTDRFYRGASANSRPGSGLGLTLVHAVASLHRAELTLEDNAPGLRVMLRFPKS